MTSSNLISTESSIDFGLPFSLLEKKEGYRSGLQVPDNEFVRQTISALDEIGNSSDEEISVKFDYLVTVEEYNINISQSYKTE